MNNLKIQNKPMTHCPLIDVHQHILPAHYVQAVGEHAVGSQGSTGRVPPWSLEAALEGMDRAGIQMAITSVSAPGFRGLNPQGERDMTRWCNDFAAELTHRYPKRFGSFAALPLSTLDACLHELSYAMDRLHSDGVCLLSNYEGRYLGDAYFCPMYEELNRRKAVVFVHPTSPLHEVKINQLSASTLEFTFDTTRTMASLVFGGVLMRFPDIRWIFSHAGGAMPYLAGRVDVLTTNNPALREFIPNGLPAELGKLYYDCALSTSDTTMDALASVASVDHVLFGTDYPFGPKDQMRKGAEAVQNLKWGEADKRRVAYSNAFQLFPRMSEIISAVVSD